MWHIYYAQAMEIAEQRAADAARERLARAAWRPAPSRSRLDGLRRTGALIAVGIAHRLDECVAREELRARSADRRASITG